MKLSYKPETRGPAVQGIAGLKMDMGSMHSGRGCIAFIQARDQGPCSIRQCRVKKDMGSMHSGRGWSFHTSQILRARWHRVKRLFP
jgi:hypothetical protein